MSLAESDSQRAIFVREYFQFLDSCGIASAVLHGWEGGFKGELTDIDYVIEEEAFPQIASLVAEYCQQAGWRMCQVLRHETTAAFCVCSAADDPSCVVALDACTAYQRNGSVFFSAAELLAGTIALPWGGNRLLEVNELKYRFMKAAAKAKPVEGIGAELAAYPETVRKECAEWLRSEWRLEMPDWSLKTLEDVLVNLHALTCRQVGFFSVRSLMRIAERVLHPTGMLLVVGPNHDEEAARLRDVFGRLYFRRVSGRKGAGVGCLPALIRSTLITVPVGGGLVRLLESSGLVLNVGDNPSGADINLAKFLEARCARRENLEEARSCH